MAIAIAIITTSIWILTSIPTINSSQTDVNCLKAFKDSVQDPNNFLSSWDFSNTAQGSICAFVGIECWHPDENRVLNIVLPDMGLKGAFPLALKNCTSMTGLDLSRNRFDGPLPTKISEAMPFVTVLRLSANKLSGRIPGDLANCSFLNVVELDNNGFSGRIPVELGGLIRIREFNVANNSLYGQVPVFQNGNISAESYAGNRGLCGGPLPGCRQPPNSTLGN